MLSEIFQVAAIIEKLPPAWKDFKNYLKHKRKETSIEDLVIRFRIEEDNRGGSSKFKKGNNKGKDTKLGPRGGVSKKQKFLGKCFNYGKQGHKSSDCRLSKRNKPKEANVIDDISKDVSDIVVIPEPGPTQLADPNRIPGDARPKPSIKSVYSYKRFRSQIFVEAVSP